MTANDRYVNLDNGRTPSGVSWRVGTQGGKLYVYVGGSLVSLQGEQRDRFAEAVARAETAADAEDEAAHTAWREG